MWGRGPAQRKQSFKKKKRFLTLITAVWVPSTENLHLLMQQQVFQKVLHAQATVFWVLPKMTSQMFFAAKLVNEMIPYTLTIFLHGEFSDVYVN
jgi:hypothetical protein